MKKLLITTITLLLSVTSYSQQIPYDKQLHFAGGMVGGVIGSAIGTHYGNGKPIYTVLGGVAGGLVLGVIKESLDEKNYNGWDNKDLGYTFLGGVTMGVTFNIASGKYRAKKREMESRIQ